MQGPAEEALGRAWRAREPEARVAAAREALRHAPDCAAALLLLAEEDAPTVIEVHIIRNITNFRSRFVLNIYSFLPKTGHPTSDDTYSRTRP